ncbi:MAG: glycosyltransferase family 87 protein [Bacteroidota bacterium]
MGNIKHHKIFILFFALFNLLLIFLTYQHPIGDFGNYYFGSKFFYEGTDPLKFYGDLHFFNSEIRNYETGPFFENYTPVPPFSLVFYLPFLVFKCTQAKILFNLFSLLVLSVSLYRMIRHLNFFSPWFYLLPLLFFFPLYSNFHQGQSYVLIAALLLEFFIAIDRHLTWRAGLIVALLFSLKIFPAFIMIVPLFKKDWKTIGWSVLFICLLQLITFLSVGRDSFVYYYFEVLPGLAHNEVTEPFGYFNQSLHVFLLNCFVFHPYLNPAPIVDFPIAAMVLQSAVYGLVLSVFPGNILKRPLYFTFFLALLALNIINQYSTVYGLLLLLPFIFLRKEMPRKKFLLSAVVIALCVSLPIHQLKHAPMLLQYCRPMLLFILFIFLAFGPGYRLNLRYWFCFFIIFMALSLDFLKIDREERVDLSKEEILYNFDVKENYIKMYCCRGSKDTVINLQFKAERADSLIILDSGSGVRSGPKMLYTSRGHIKKCLLVNDTCLMALTDEYRGKGLYRLIMKKIDPQ